MSLLLWTLLCGIIVAYAYLRRRRRNSNAVLPPGPTPLPFIGNLHQFSKNASITLSQWARQYGKLYTIYLGSKPTLVVNDASLMRQLFRQPATIGSYQSEVLNVIYGPYGFISGNCWQEQRLFSVNALKHAGIGRTTNVEVIALEEIEYVGNMLEEEMHQKGKVCLSEPFKAAVGDTLWCMMTEERTKTNLPQLLEDLMIGLENVTNSGVAFFSWIKDIAPNASGYNDFVKATGNLHDFLQKRFDDPRRISGEQKDLLQRFMEHNQNMQDKNSIFYGEEGQKHNFSNVLALLLGGMETTSTTMHFLIFYLTAHPEVQGKLQNEIDQTIGVEREPTLDDQNRMPYLEAVIEETLRMSAALPFGLMLSTVEDMTFEGYTLPKGLLLLANISHVLSDPTVWGDPENFRPERFLEDASSKIEGTTREKRRELDEYMVAFQPGKRGCPGEKWARDVLFLFTVQLLRRFTFAPENGRDRAEYMEKRFSYIQMPHNYGVRITSRN